MRRTESPSVIAEQRSLIEDLAHSNQDYIRNFENLRLRIGEDAIEDGETTSKAGAVESELSTKTESFPPATKRKFDSMNFATLRTPLQDGENIRGLGFNEPTNATRLSPNVRGGLTNLLATPPNADINNLFINTGGQSNTAMPPLQVQGKPTMEAPLGFDQEVLFKQLRYFSTLVHDLLKKVDEPQYKITFQSRLRMKGGIAGLHEGERRELEKMWGCTALHKAEQRLDSLVEEVEDLPAMRRSVPSAFSANDSSWHSGESFAYNSDKWPSPFLTTKPSVPYHAPQSQRRKGIQMPQDIQMPQGIQIVPKGRAEKKSRRPTIEAEAEQHAPKPAGSIGPSTDAPFVGYVKPHQQFSVRERGADIPFQPSASAASVKSYSRFDDFEAGVDVRTLTHYINVYSSQLMQFDSIITACHPTTISTVRISLRTLISSSTCKKNVILILVGSRGPTMTCVSRHFQSLNLQTLSMRR